MSTKAGLLSLTDYAALDEPEDAYVTELVRGVVVREPRPHRRHGRLQVEMAYHLNRWVRAHGAEVTGESGYIISEDPATVRGPDVAVVLEPRPSDDEPGGWVRGAPDVAVEILSPSDSSTAIRRMILDYMEAGARLVWIVDPVDRSVMVHRPDGSANLVREEQSLDGEDVLAGFSVLLNELFE